MAVGTPTSAEVAASALGGTELVRGVQSGANVKITIDQIKTYIQTGEAVLTANTFTATQTINPAVNTAALAISGASLTGSNASSFATISGTWNTSGAPDGALRIVITDTASGSTSKAFSINGGVAGTTPLFTVDRSGAVVSAGTFTSASAVVGGSFQAANTGAFYWFTGTIRAVMRSPAASNISLLDGAETSFGLLQFGGTTSSYPAMKRNAAGLEGRLADDSAFCSVKGKLTTDTNATTGLTAGVLAALTNASIVVYDGAGQAYRIPCII